MRLRPLQAGLALHVLLVSASSLVRGEEQQRLHSARRDSTLKNTSEDTDHLAGSSHTVRKIQRDLQSAVGSGQGRRIPEVAVAGPGGTSKILKGEGKMGVGKAKEKGLKGVKASKGLKGIKVSKGLKGASKGNGKGGKGSSKSKGGKGKGRGGSKGSKGGATSGCSETIFYYNNKDFKNSFNGEGKVATNGQVPLYNEDGKKIGLYSESTIVIGERNCISSGAYSFDFKKGVPKSQIFTAQTCCGVEMQAVAGGTGVFQCTTGFVEQLELDSKPNRTYRRIVVCESASGLCSA